ncbi:MAG: hypothetical protein NTX44_02075 [Ignavibacteriales bacterium]|nr:hypothetical protein [Ignavibacteriales bacterium]
MKKLLSISSLFILALVLSPLAFSQTTNSATQTVMFAVNRPVKPTLNTLASIQNSNTSSTSSEAVALRNQLKQQSSKVTVFTLPSMFSNVHLD